VHKRQSFRTAQTYQTEQVISNQLHKFVHHWWSITHKPGEKAMSDEQVVELLQSCTMKPEDIIQLEDIRSRMEILNEIEKRLRLIVEELRDC
jgi:hypothetical protein